MNEMLAADDGDPKTMAEMHDVQIGWNDNVYRAMAPINEIAYPRRQGGTSTGRGASPRRTVGSPVG